MVFLFSARKRLRFGSSSLGLEHKKMVLTLTAAEFMHRQHQWSFPRALVLREGAPGGPFQNPRNTSAPPVYPVVESNQLSYR